VVVGSSIKRIVKTTKNDMKLILGDSVDKLKELDDNSIDSIVTDPPYGLSFMGKKWDYDVPSQEIFEECLRVLKPGGYLLSFAGSRTYHRMAVRVEDAGFEIRDQIMWIYGSGFPKSLNIGKKVDEYEGWGTALKPAHEPIVMARKPLSEKTVVNNVLEWGTGGINVEESRIPYKSKDDMEIRKNTHRETNKLGDGNFGGGKYSQPVESGRFPSNIIFDEEAGKILDEQTGQLKSGFMKAGTPRLMSDNPNKNTYGKWNPDTVTNDTYGDKGGASRFFYCPKTSKRDRNEGLENFEGKQIGTYNAHSSDLENYGGSSLGAASMSGNNKMPQPKQNFHPTVKPTDLMLYLIRLVTPKGGTTLDPFMGSGSTGKAATRGGFDFVGVERDKEYMKIAKTRIQYEKDNPYNEEKGERIQINKNASNFW
jgi:site-specific DNA-methyltransferase (adenine-specific)